MKSFNLIYVLKLSLVSAMGGLLFGYDWVVIGGAKPFYELYFGISLNPGLQGWAMSSALIGCIFGAMMAGGATDRFGRKKLLILAAILFSFSAYGTGISNEFKYFILFRLIGGLGIGIASTVSPIYIAEVAPKKIRGIFVSINQLTIVLGILAAQIVNWQIARPIPDEFASHEILQSWNGQMGWRWMFWAELVPSLTFFILMFFLPETPRFLVKVRKYEIAEKILNKIGGAAYGKETLKNIKQSLANSSTGISLKPLLDKSLMPILLLGVVLAAFQQWCGINVIFNYAEEVFTSAGYNVNEMFMNIVITGSINLVFTIVAMGMVDKIGRRKLMLFGSAGLAIIYTLIGLFYFMNIKGLPVLILVLAGIAVYAMSLAPVTWVVLSEIFPNRIRGIALSMATLSLWVASSLLVFTFPLLNNSVGTFGTFWLYGFICIAGFIFIFRRLPETKGKSLEEIEIQFMKTRNNNEESQSLD